MSLHFNLSHQTKYREIFMKIMFVFKQTTLKFVQ